MKISRLQSGKGKQLRRTAEFGEITKFRKDNRRRGHPNPRNSQYGRIKSKDTVIDLSEVEQSGLAATKLKRLDMMIEEKEKEIEGYQEFRRKLLEAFREKLIDRMEYDAMRQKCSSMIEKAQAALGRSARNAMRLSAKHQTGATGAFSL